MTDEDLQRSGNGHQQPPEQQLDLWEKMSWMLDAKLDSKMGALERNVHQALAAVETSLGTRITAEEERRSKELLATNQRIDDAMMRIEGLELNAPSAKIADINDRLSALEQSPSQGLDKNAADHVLKQSAPDGWLADHVVVGGWRPEAGNAENIAAMEVILHHMPAA